MPDDDVQRMEAGRELDRLIHVEVFGCEDEHDFRQRDYHEQVQFLGRWYAGLSTYRCSRCDASWLADGFESLKVGPCIPAVPPYSTDIKAAWSAVEHLNRQGFTVATNTGRNRAPCAWVKPGWGSVYGKPIQAPTVPLAICRASLRAARASARSSSTSGED